MTATTTTTQEWGWAAEDAALAVLTVHGRGQDPGFMREVSQRFGDAPVRFYAPHAPEGSWYPQPFREPIELNQPNLDAALARLDGCLDALAACGFAEDRVVLWGFSQGACLLAHHVSLHARPYAGLVLFTGGYLGPLARTAPSGEPLTGVPALLRSIHDDPWVPRERVVATALLLSTAGASIDLRIDPGDEHVITDEACRAATELLRAMGQSASSTA